MSPLGIINDHDHRVVIILDRDLQNSKLLVHPNVNNKTISISFSDEETVISAVKNYAASPDKDLNRLAVYASMFGVDKELKRYMEVLL